MKINNIGWIAAAAGMMLVSGCAYQSVRIDPASNQGLTTVDDINFKDWQIAAEKGVNSLLQSGVLHRADGRKTIVMVSVVKNSTAQHINTNILTDKIRQAILRSGMAVTTTAVSGAGPEDAASKQVRQLAADPMFNGATVQRNGTAIAPDMSLAGEIIQQQTQAGSATESYFFFHMTMTDLKTGLAVWEDNVEIAKQGSNGSIGW